MTKNHDNSASRSRDDDDAARALATAERCISHARSRVLDHWDEWLEVAARFPHLGFRATLLIWNQWPSATQLAEYETWRRRGQPVKQGAHGIRVPRSPTANIDAGGKSKPDRRATSKSKKKHTRINQDYTVLFDASQTKGIRMHPVSSGDIDTSTAWNALARFAVSRGYYVDHATAMDDDKSGSMIDWERRRIRISPHLTGTVAIHRLARELGHLLLRTSIPPPTTANYHGVQKLESESVAYLVLARLGLDTSMCDFPRPSAWAGADPRARPEDTASSVAKGILHAGALIDAHLDAYVPRYTIDNSRCPPVAHRSVANEYTAITEAILSRLRAKPYAPPQGPLVSLHQLATDFFARQLPRSWVPEYLDQRGFPRSIATDWTVGYAPRHHSELVRHLRAITRNGQRVYDDDTIIAAGLARRWDGDLVDFFRDRLILPIRDPSGLVVAFIGRAPEKADTSRIPKYLNSPTTDIYHKGKVLFGLHEQTKTLRLGAVPILVEGPLDAIAISQADSRRFAGLALCGTALTSDQVTSLNQVTDIEQCGLRISLDPDAAGIRGAQRALAALHSRADHVYFQTLPPGKDPAKLLSELGPRGLQRILTSTQRPLLDVIIDHRIKGSGRAFEHIESTCIALTEAAQVLCGLPPGQVFRQVDRIAYHLDLPHHVVMAAVEDLIDAPSPQPSQPPDGPTTSSDRSATAVAGFDFPKHGSNLQDSPTMSPQRAERRSPSIRPGRTR